LAYLTAEQIVERARDKMVFLDSQKDTVWHIASIISLHLRRLASIEAGINPKDLPRISTLYLAGSGTGKTYLLKTLAQVADCDLFVCDSSNITPSGYRGQNLDNFLYETYKSMNDPARWSRSIFLFDEFCKTAYGKNGRDEAFNPQSSFLTMMDGSDIYVSDKEGTTILLDTTKPLFLFSGAFEGIQQYAISDKKSSSIGFLSSASLESKCGDDIMKEVTLNHVQRYGILKELTGRIGSIHYIPPLGMGDFKKLICDGTCSLRAQYERLFASDGISLEITEKAVEEIAHRAEKERIGARAASPIIRESIMRAANEVDADKRINHIIIDADESDIVLNYCRGPRAPVTKTVTQSSFNPGLSLSNTIHDEEKLNGLITEMISSLHDDCLAYQLEPTAFYFLQTSLRFLAMCTNAEDQTFESILKLKQTVSWEYNQKSSFDILISDVFKNPAYDRAEKETLRHFYNRFKAIEWSRTPSLLNRALNLISANWIPRADMLTISA